MARFLFLISAILTVLAGPASAQSSAIPPQFGPHAYPAQDTITRKTFSCGKMEVVVELEQHSGWEPKPTSLAITIDGRPMAVEDVDRLLKASKRLDRIFQIGVNCIEGRAVDVTLYGRDPTGDKVRALLDGRKLLRID